MYLLKPLLQVVKVRVIDFDPVTKRLQLSVAKKGKAPATGTSKPVPGEVLAGSVTSMKLQEDGSPSSYRIELERDGKAVGKGIVEAAHLADHPSAIEAFQESLQVLLSHLLCISSRGLGHCMYLAWSQHANKAYGNMRLIRFVDQIGLLVT